MLADLITSISFHILYSALLGRKSATHPQLAAVAELDWRSAPALDVQYTHEVNKTNWQDWLLSVVAGLTDEVRGLTHFSR